MTIRAILTTILVVHLFMLFGLFFTINDHPELDRLTKVKLFLLALVLPIIGPIYVNYVLKTKAFINGRFIGTSDYSDGHSTDGNNLESGDTSGSSYSSDGGGGGGD